MFVSRSVRHVVAPESPFTFTLPSVGDLGPDSWIRAEGAGLVQPVEVKFRVAGARLRIVGLRLDNGQEIGSSALRFRIAEMAQALLDHLRSYADLVSDDERARFNASTRALADGPEGYDPEMDQLLETGYKLFQREAIDLFLRRVEDEPVTWKVRGRGAKPPTDVEFREFARVYTEELRRRASGAKQRTADRLHMDRGTVYRWIKICRERGILLPEEES
jgi:hypothetical protein